MSKKMVFDLVFGLQITVKGQQAMLLALHQRARTSYSLSTSALQHLLPSQARK